MNDTRQPFPAAGFLLLALGLATLPAQARRQDRHRPAPAEAPSEAAIQAAERARAAGLAAARDAEARAEAADAEARRLAGIRVGAAAALRDTETELAGAGDRIEALAARRAALDAELAAQAARLGLLMPVVVRLALFPAETLLASPLPPEQALRGLAVLKGVAAGLEGEARALRAAQAEADRLTTAIGREQAAGEAARARQAQLGQELDRQIAAARENGRAATNLADTASRAAAEQAARASSMRGLLDQLEAARRAAEARAAQAAARAEAEAQATAQALARQAQREAARARRTASQEQEAAQDRTAVARAAAAVTARNERDALARPADPGFAAGRSVLLAPVTGRVAAGFGDVTEAGAASGISYRPAPGARVVSPCAGRVGFAAAFRSYGLTVIIDCGGGFHVVLAGLARLDVQAGRPVQSGEPVGAMGSDRTALYLELRRGGAPVNPAPYLRTRS